MQSAHKVLKRSRRIVVKIGSSLLTQDGKGLDQAAISRWAQQIANLREQGREIILVSSGAIAEGRKRLGYLTRPRAIHELQACAAVGQMGLVQMYESCFRLHQIQTAQILLTHADLADRTRYLNARATLRTLLNLGVLPIINENDTVVTDEIKLGDNDTLGALVTNLIEADVLVILTDQAGLYTKDPRSNPDAHLIHEAGAGDPTLEMMAGGAGSNVGTGGMLTKVLAAKRASFSGAHTVIASGREHDVLSRLMEGETIGTCLLAHDSTLSSRKQWMLDHLQTAGQLILDAGAVQKLCFEGKSLLPVGISDVIGEFNRGAVVTCLGSDGRAIARGLSNYSAADLRRIKQRNSNEIMSILGYVEEDEAIHRDNLVMLISA